MIKFVSHKARFKGTLAGINVNDLGNLDYNIVNIKDRRRFIDDKINMVKPFLDEYFLNYKVKDDNDNGEFEHIEHTDRMYYNYKPNVDDELSEEINVCKYVQQYANYLLNSSDLPSEKKQQYNILTEEEFNKILKKEMAMQSNGQENDNNNLMDVLDLRPSNDYINMKHSITKADFKDIEIMDVLIDYEKYKDHLKAEMEKIKSGEGSYLDLYTIRTLLSKINDDMLLSKIKLKGIRNPAKRLGDESPYNDFSTLDYSNPKHVLQILKYIKVCSLRPDSESSHIGYDLGVAIEKLKEEKKLNEVDIEIIECYNTGTYSYSQIAEEINMSKQAVDKRLRKISKLISEVM